MADVYGRLTGRAGVCMSTLGPGATNLITGVADANMDRAPIVAIAKEAQTEKPGATYIDFPEDVAEMEVDKQPIRVQTAYTPEAPAHKIEQIAKLISTAKAPVILAGNGVIRQGAADALVTFAEVLRIPVANTFMA